MLAFLSYAEMLTKKIVQSVNSGAGIVPVHWICLKVVGQ